MQLIERVRTNCVAYVHLVSQKSVNPFIYVNVRVMPTANKLLSTTQFI